MEWSRLYVTTKIDVPVVISIPNQPASTLFATRKTRAHFLPFHLGFKVSRIKAVESGFWKISKRIPINKKLLLPSILRVASDAEVKCKLKLLSITCNRNESSLIEWTTISLIDINLKFRNLLLLLLPYAIVRLMYIFVNHVPNFSYCAPVRYSLFSTYLSYVLISTKRRYQRLLFFIY